MSDSKPSLTVQASWLLTARLAAFAIGLLLPPILVRVFDRQQVGTYREIFLVLSTVVNVLPLGFTMSAFYYLPREKERRGMVVLNIVLFLSVVGIVAGSAIAFFPGILRLALGSSTSLVPYAPQMGIITFLWLFSGLLENIATANEDVASSTFFIIVAQLTKTVFILSAVLIFRSIAALLWAAITQGVFESLLLLWYLRRAFPSFHSRFEWSMFKEQTSYVAPLGLSGFVYAAQNDLHSYIVAHQFNPAQYAIYSIGSAQLPLIGTLRDSVVSVMLARVSSLQQLQMTDQIRELMLSAVRKLTAIYFPVSIALCVLGKQFLITVYTAKYLDSWPVLALNALYLPFGALITDPVLRAFAEHRYTTLKVRLVMLVVLVAIALPAIHYLGVVGAMLAYVLAATIERLSLFAFSMKILGMKKSDWAYLADLPKLLGASICAGIAVELLKWALPTARPQVMLVAGSALFSVIYLAGIWITGAISEDEQNLVNRLCLRYLRFSVFRQAN